MELQLGVFDFFADHACGNKMYPRSSLSVWPFMRVYLHAQTAVGLHTHLTNHGYCDSGGNLNTPNRGPMPGFRWCRFWDLQMYLWNAQNYTSSFFIVNSNMQAKTSVQIGWLALYQQSWKGSPTSRGGEGYLDLVWTGVCCLSIKPLLIYKGHFGRKGY